MLPFVFGSSKHANGTKQSMRDNVYVCFWNQTTIYSIVCMCVCVCMFGHKAQIVNNKKRKSVVCVCVCGEVRTTKSDTSKSDIGHPKMGKGIVVAQLEIEK